MKRKASKQSARRRSLHATRARTSPLPSRPTFAAQDTQPSPDKQTLFAELGRLLTASCKRTGSVERKLRKILNESRDERNVHAFLKEHDFLVGMTFRSNTNPGGVISEFELGAEFRPDFIVLSSCSAWWTADFVELESPKARLYLAARTESKILRTANRQIRDWKLWSRHHEDYLRSRLSGLFAKHQVPASGALPMIEYAADEILHPNCVLTSHYHIVIGRRKQLTPAEQLARTQDSLDHHVNIATYDRLLESASRYDRATTFDKEGLRYRKG